MKQVCNTAGAEDQAHLWERDPIVVSITESYVPLWPGSPTWGTQLPLEFPEEIPWIPWGAAVAILLPLLLWGTGSSVLVCLYISNRNIKNTNHFPVRACPLPLCSKLWKVGWHWRRGRAGNILVYRAIKFPYFFYTWLQFLFCCAPPLFQTWTTASQHGGWQHLVRHWRTLAALCKNIFSDQWSRKLCSS